MTYCGEEDSIFYPDIDKYPMQIYIYDEKHERLQDLDYTVYDRAFEYWFYDKDLEKDKIFYYQPISVLQLPAGKYTAEFIYRYPNDDGEIVTDIIEKKYEVVPNLL